MNKHDFSQSNVAAISASILSCRDIVMNYVLSTEAMPYSWDTGIVNTVVTWLEVLQVNSAKDQLERLMQKSDEKLERVSQRIGSVDLKAYQSMQDGETTLSSLKEKFLTIQEYSVQSVSSVGAFGNLHSTLFSINEKYNNVEFDKLSEEEKRDYFDRLNGIPDDQLTEEDKARIQKYIDYLKDKFVVDGNLSEEEKRFIALYEKIHPDEQKAMDKFFDKSSGDGINENDKFNIKYIAYTSEGDCHTIFFEYIDRCRVDTWCYTKDGKPGTSHYNSQDRAVRLNLHDGKDGVANPRGAYNTVFHEIGHNIDDAMREGEVSFSNSGDFGKELWRLINSDVECRFSSWIDNVDNNSDWINLKQEDKDKILDVLMGRKSYMTLNPYLLGIADGIKLSYYNSYNGYDYEQITDVTGGITNDYMHDSLGIRGQSGHDDVWFWKDSYWYYKADENGKPILDKDGNYIPIKCGEATENKLSGGAQNSEFFAEYFAYEMTGDKDEIAARNYFSESYKAMDEAIAKKAEEIRNMPTDEEMLQAYWN